MGRIRDFGRRLQVEELEERRLLSVTTTLVSRPTWPSESPNGSSGASSMSADNRFVLISSDAPNLAAGIEVAAGAYNLYRHDRLTGENILVNVGLDGAAAPSVNFQKGISADGDLVVFSSQATNLHVLDVDAEFDIFARRISTGETLLVSVNAFGTGSADRDCSDFSMSADGKTIVFASEATNLHPLDTSILSDVFVHDLETGVTRLVSRNLQDSGGGNGESYLPQVSSDGSVAVFASRATNLLAIDSNAHVDLYARNLVTDALQLVSINAAGTSGGNGSVEAFSVSADGNRIAFESLASNQHLLDTDSDNDVFVRDMATATTMLVSVGATGSVGGNGSSVAPVISANGEVVAFTSFATNLTNLIGQRESSIYARNLATNTTKLVTMGADGLATRDYLSYLYNGKGVSPDGRYVVFTSSSSDISAFDMDGVYVGLEDEDVFLRDLELDVTRLVSKNIAGTANGNRSSMGGRFSHDGRFLIFASSASDLVEFDGNGRGDAFLYELDSEAVTLLSKLEAGAVRGRTANDDSHSGDASVSADGRYVVFSSRATDLLVGPDLTTEESRSNVFRLDRSTGEIELVSVNLAGNFGGNGWSGDAQISADGKVVVFQSVASDLVDALGSAAINIFVRNMETGITQLASPLIGPYGNFSGTNSVIKISDNGRVVAFTSTAQAAHPLKPLGTQRDVLAFDVETGVVHLVSINSAGTKAGNGYSIINDISADGSKIAFTSESSNLHPLDTDNVSDVFVRDIFSGETMLVSVALDGVTGSNGHSRDASISDDGNRVAFASTATNLDLMDSSSGWDIYVRELDTNVTRLVSVNAAGNGGSDTDDLETENVEISGNGNVVVYGYRRLSARNLVANTTEIVSVSSNGAIGNGRNFDVAVSADGDTIAFISASSNLHPLDTDPSETDADIYVRRRSLGKTELVSVDFGGTTSANDESWSLRLNGWYGNGDLVLYTSLASNLVERDWNDAYDVFIAQVNWNSPELPGDYDRNGAVDAADYSVWRDSLGSIGLEAYSGADGNGDGEIDADDYGVWKANFGRVAESENGRAAMSSTELPRGAGDVGHVDEVGSAVHQNRLGDQSESVRFLSLNSVAPAYKRRSLKSTQDGKATKGAVGARLYVMDKALVAWVAERIGMAQGLAYGGCEFPADNEVANSSDSDTLDEAFGKLTARKLLAGSS